MNKDEMKSIAIKNLEIDIACMEEDLRGQKQVLEFFKNNQYQEAYDAADSRFLWSDQRS